MKKFLTLALVLILTLSLLTPVLAQTPESSPTSLPYSDVPETYIYYDAIRWCWMEGLLEDSSEFRPFYLMSRKDFYDILGRVYGVEDGLAYFKEIGAVASGLDEDGALTADEVKEALDLDEAPNALTRGAICNALYSSILPYAYEVEAEAYETGSDGIQDTFQTFSLPAVRWDQMDFYNLSDCLALIGQEADVRVEDGTAYVTYLGEEYTFSLEDKMAVRGDDGTYSLCHECVYMGRELYLPWESLHSLSPRLYFSNGRINILLGSTYPAFLSNSAMADTVKEKLLGALWTVHQTYPRGYEIVMENASVVKLASKSVIEGMTGESDCTACINNNSKQNVIYWDKDAILTDDTDSLAGVLVHESSHLYLKNSRGKELESMEEEYPLVQQVKTLFYIDQNNRLDKDHTDRFLRYAYSEDDPYYEGYVLAKAWVANQRGLAG